MDDAMDLKRRSAQRLATTMVFLAALLFLPGSWRFWPGWIFLGLMLVCWTFFFLDLLKHDPQLLQRRLRRRETEPEQKLFQKLFPLIVLPAIALAGFDFRFGWSRGLYPVPVALILAGEVGVAAAYWFVFWVMRTNTFAGTTIEVESEQRVVDIGPYAWVRHPMYAGMIAMALATPLALGSYVALPVFALLVPVLMYRLIHEEKTLLRDLPGYAEYCERTRFRLLPRIW